MSETDTHLHLVELAGGIESDGRELLLLVIYVLAEHGYNARAEILADALYRLGDRTVDVVQARAVLRFQARDWRGALARLEELDRIDPVERFGSYRLKPSQRMRRYMRARCLFELDEPTREALDVYLRHAVPIDS